MQNSKSTPIDLSTYRALEYGDYLDPLDSAASSADVVRVLEVVGEQGVWVAPHVHHLPGPTLMPKDQIVGRYQRVPYQEAQRNRLTQAAVHAAGVAVAVVMLAYSFVTSSVLGAAIGVPTLLYFAVQALVNWKAFAWDRTAKATKAWFKPAQSGEF